MFGKNSQEVENLKKEIRQLRESLETLQTKQDQALKTLRQQLAANASGLPFSPQSILAGLGYSELPKEQVPPFIRAIPNLLILDVRSDEGWSTGHIPQAKHVPASQVFQRLVEFPDKQRPILTICANGNTAVGVCQMLVKEGYQFVYNALGGMAGYGGEVIRPEVLASDIESVKGVDRDLVAQVIEVIDRDIRPGLKRDGGDLQVLAVEDGTVKIKMVGACVGCGSQKRTVEDGIKNHLKKMVPGIREVEDYSLGLASG